MNPNVAASPGRPNVPTSTRANSHWPEILAAVEDRSVRPAELVRLILMEMSLVCHELQTLSGHSSLEFKLKPLLAEVHALRTLAETTRYAIGLAVQTDTVNLQERQTYYLVEALVGVFEESALQAGCSAFLWDSTLRAFRDIIRHRQEDIVRGMMKVAASPEGVEASVWPKRASNESATNSPGDTAVEHPTT